MTSRDIILQSIQPILIYMNMVKEKLDFAILHGF